MSDSPAGRDRRPQQHVRVQVYPAGPGEGAADRIHEDLGEPLGIAANLLEHGAPEVGI